MYFLSLSPSPRFRMTSRWFWTSSCGPSTSRARGSRWRPTPSPFCVARAASPPPPPASPRQPSPTTTTTLGPLPGGTGSRGASELHQLPWPHHKPEKIPRGKSASPTPQLHQGQLTCTNCPPTRWTLEELYQVNPIISPYTNYST